MAQMFSRLNMLGIGWRGVRFSRKVTNAAVSAQTQRRYSTDVDEQNRHLFGLLFDIDGVLVRGRTPIPAAKQCFRNLVDGDGKYKVPVVFVTNAGNALRQTKAEQLSHLLEVEVSPEQVVLSHSPLRVFTQFHDMCVLVSGQGPVVEVAHNVGFKNVVTIDMLREAYPLLDVVDHHRRPKDTIPQTKDLPHIDAVILFGEPIRWETNLQLIVDVLLTNGRPGNPVTSLHYPHIPVLACNMDLLWMAEAKNPRFGHGMFLVCLESIYKKITGCELKYEALIGKPSVVTYNYAELLIREQAEKLGWTRPVQRLYAIGDNPMADIYGANLYNRYLKAMNRSRTPQVQAQGGVSGQMAADLHCDDAKCSGQVMVGGSFEHCLPEACSSILVCTGVYNRDMPTDPQETLTEHRIFHGHRDFRFDPSLTQPSFIVNDVRDGVELVFQLEGWPLE
ncbi:haloacid dehalogenase-like hydrolase domain-containing 5 [Danio rerio]|uniref:Haloacid dehalogenase-like hydrolase domain-containing 5 n=1 Tax=Danio rerio TaxID=7955 RepID=A0A0R4IJ50_DANRE|nr:haloacid dehalogenase-like hydrolase domain-containing 5 [Danio rerio]|eukprot:NP_001315451.1 cat eye syndrome chromosome region, candidate 5 [Danio rerio]